jgi:hypothetical protein
MSATVVVMELELLVKRAQSCLAREERRQDARVAIEDQCMKIIAKYKQGKSVHGLARIYDVSRDSLLRVVKP